LLLPQSIRDALINDLEEYLGALPDDPDPEMVTAFIIEQLETYADEKGIDDIIVSLEESGSLDTTLQETLEAEMSSNDDFEFTEEECVSLLESITDIEWIEDDDDVEEDLEDEEEEEEEEAEPEEVK
jgi:dynactin complex subunit